MPQLIPEELAASRALQYVVSKGWEWKEGSGGQIQIEVCPFCKKDGWKFYMSVGNPAETTRDGLYMCFHGSCQKTGNLTTLKEHLQDSIPGVTSRNDWVREKGGGEKPDALPDIEACHTALLGDADALDYLLNVRGFTREIVEKQKLGLKDKVHFREAGDVRALVIPYLVQGNCVFAKYRTLPPSPKDFSCPKGWDSPLYNGEIIQEGINEIVFVEGEADALACLSHGIDNVVGVPGANFRKATWIEALDRIAPEKIYILYDNDQAGTKGAQELASRIGIEHCYKIVLPPFEVEPGKQGKDVNEWFLYGGGSKEKLEELKKDAKLFDVSGVTSTGDALTVLENSLKGKVDLAPTYISPWKELNKLVGFEDGDVIDIIAPEKVGKTTLGLNLLDHMVKTYGEDGLLVCLEMTQDRLARKWVSLVTGFEDIITEPGTPEAKAKLDELLQCIEKARAEQATRKADLYFAYPLLVKEPEDVYKLIRDCIRRYGVKWVMFDNIQKLADDTLKNHNHGHTHLSQISKAFAKIAKDYKVKMVRILQPKRIEKGATVSTGDVYGSSQIAKDCDCMISMWRNAVGIMTASQWEKNQGETTEALAFEPKTRLHVGLSRYSSGGAAVVWFDGARSQVVDYDKGNKLQLPKVNFNGIIPAESSTQSTVSAPDVTVEL